MFKKRHKRCVQKEKETEGLDGGPKENKERMSLCVSWPDSLCNLSYLLSFLFCLLKWRLFLLYWFAVLVFLYSFVRLFRLSLSAKINTIFQLCNSIFLSQQISISISSS